MSAKTENQDHHTTMSGLKKKKECQYVLPQMSGFAAVLQTRVRRFLALLNHEATGRRRKKPQVFTLTSTLSQFNYRQSQNHWSVP